MSGKAACIRKRRVAMRHFRHRSRDRRRSQALATEDRLEQTVEQAALGRLHDGRRTRRTDTDQNADDDGCDEASARRRGRIGLAPRSPCSGPALPELHPRRPYPCDPESCRSETGRTSSPADS